jgi:hypothetical protein
MTIWPAANILGGWPTFVHTIRRPVPDTYYSCGARNARPIHACFFCILYHPLDRLLLFINSPVSSLRRCKKILEFPLCLSIYRISLFSSYLLCSAEIIIFFLVIMLHIVT